MDFDVIEFLQQSNYIEGVRDGLDDSVKAWEYIISQSEITIPVILKTHKILMANKKLLPSQTGFFRKKNVRIGHYETYPFSITLKGKEKFIRHFVDTGKPANFTDIELLMKNLIEMIKVPPSKDLVGLWALKCHIFFENIHPFIDGNGRVGRILLNWQRVKYGLPILIIREEDKVDYYKWFK